MVTLSEDTEIRRLPWKPKEGDSFWIVNSDDYIRCRTWRGSMADLVYFCSGNCFRTAEDADVSRERIKGDLMNYYKRGAVVGFCRNSGRTSLERA